MYLVNLDILVAQGQISLVCGPVWPNIQLIEGIMHFLDLNKIEGTRVATTFFPLYMVDIYLNMTLRTSKVIFLKSDSSYSSCLYSLNVFIFFLCYHQSLLSTSQACKFYYIVPWKSVVPT